MNNFDFDYLSSFGFFLKGGIISSLEYLLENKNVVNIEYDKEKQNIKYYFNNGIFHSLSSVRFSFIIKEYPNIFSKKLLNIKDFLQRKGEIDNIRKNLSYESIKEYEWENLLYFENIDIDLNNNIEYNIKIIEKYLCKKYNVENDVDIMINNAWKRFFNYGYMKEYIIPTIEKYEYWKSLHKGNTSFHEAYKDYTN